jgi:hypothetical protein
MFVAAAAALDALDHARLFVHADEAPALESIVQQKQQKFECLAAVCTAKHVEAFVAMTMLKKFSVITHIHAPGNGVEGCGAC